MELDSDSQLAPSATTQQPVFSARASAALKLLVLGGLTLLLLIPVSQILDLVRERAARLSGVRSEVASSWGRDQTLGAAVLSFPVRSRLAPAAAPQPPIATYPVANPVPPVPRRVFFLPAEVRWSGRIDPEVRRKGLFEAAVYVADLEVEGSFGAPDLAALGVDAEDVVWEEATLFVGITAPQAIANRPTLRWNGTEVPLGPAGRSWAWGDGLVARLGDTTPRPGARPVAFSLSLELRGSEVLNFLPLGEMTTVALTSPWPDPGFGGTVLPRERRIAADGFEAKWEVPWFGRGYPQSWTDLEDASPSIPLSAFGVTLVLPADQYQQTERAVKYAALFIVLTFTTLFLLELLSQARLHAVQYLLVGFALCLFYQLLLALAEHGGFARAYLVAATATTSLIALYAKSLLGAWNRVGVLAGSLGLLYGYLFALLGAEDQALLIGSIGLFVVLAAVMYLTRRLDWYTLRFSPQE